MGLFSFTQDVAIDLGTANTIVSYNGKIVVDEPSVVAIDGQKKMIAVGEKAKQMHEKTNPNIQTIRPLRDGAVLKSFPNNFVSFVPVFLYALSLHY